MPIAFSIKQIKLLEDFLKGISDNEFASLKDTIFNSTVGKHTRHIIDFYHAFFTSYENGTTLCYDDRRKIKNLETNLDLAIANLSDIRRKLPKFTKEKKLLLKATINEEEYLNTTNSTRELLFLSDHTTHHIAIIRLILAQYAVNNKRFNNLGVAYSTPKQ